MLLASGPLALGVPELLFLAIIACIFVVPCWVICGKLGWPPPLGLLALLPLVGLIFIIMLSWEALPRAEASRWLMLLLLFPLLGLIMLFWLAFSEWETPAAAGAPQSPM